MATPLSEIEALLWHLKRLPDAQFYVVMNMAFDMHRAFHQDFMDELRVAYASYTSIDERKTVVKSENKR